MRTPIFRGAATAIVTPFTETGVDYDKFAELVEYQIAHGIDALVVCGTTGESPTMPTDEHLEVIKRAVEFVAGRVPVIAGTGSNSTMEALDQSRHAMDVGADALLLVSPYYNKTTQKGLVEHFNAVAKAVPLPVILYNVPSRTSININSETLAELSKTENIVAVKECNLDQVGASLTMVEPDFVHYTGEDGCVLPMLAWGGQGVISVMSNVVPQLTHDLCQQWFDGDRDEALRTQLSLIPLVKALFSEVSPIPVKEALNIMGLAVGVPRLPLVPASPGVREALDKAMRDLGVEHI